MKSLLAANHHVTLYAPFSSDLPHQNLTIINSRVETSKKANPYAPSARPNVSSFKYSLNALNVAEKDCHHALTSKELKVSENKF